MGPEGARSNRRPLSDTKEAASINGPQISSVRNGSRMPVLPRPLARRPRRRLLYGRSNRRRWTPVAHGLRRNGAAVRLAHFLRSQSPRPLRRPQLFPGPRLRAGRPAQRGRREVAQQFSGLVGQAFLPVSPPSRRPHRLSPHTMFTQATLNAALNATSGVALLFGYAFIRRKNVPAHRLSMLIATGASIVFLVSYVLYHLRVGSIHFQGTGWTRPAYFSLLISH